MTKKKRTVSKPADPGMVFIGKLVGENAAGSGMSEKERVFILESGLIEREMTHARKMLDDLRYVVELLGRIAKSKVYSDYIRSAEPYSRNVRIYADILRPILKSGMDDNPHMFVGTEDAFLNHLKDREHYEENKEMGVVSIPNLDRTYRSRLTLVDDALIVKNLKEGENAAEYRRYVATVVTLSIINVLGSEAQKASIGHVIDRHYEEAMLPTVFLPEETDYRLRSLHLTNMVMFMSILGISKEEAQEFYSKRVSPRAVRLAINRVISMTDNVDVFIDELYSYTRADYAFYNDLYNKVNTKVQEFIEKGEPLESKSD